MRFDVLNINFIREDKRLEGSFFLNDYALNSRKIQKHSAKCVPLSKLAFVFNPPVFKRQFCQNTERAVPYCQSSDVTNFLDGSEVYINKSQAIRTSTIVKEKQILATGFGTIGNFRLVNRLCAGIAYANNVCRIEANDYKYYGFLYAFLCSKFGVGQLNKNASGSVVRYIEAPGIKKSLIPNLSEPQKIEIHKLIIKGEELREEGNIALNNAMKRFDLALNIHVKNSYKSVSLREIKVYQNRLDAQFAINYHLLNKLITSQKYIELGQVTSNIFMGPRSKRLYVLKGTGFLNTSDIMLKNPSKPHKYVSQRTIGFNIEKDWILISRSGTIGKCVIAGDILSKFNITEDAIRIVCKKEILHPNYVYAYLSSKIGTQYITAGAFGSVIQHIDENYLLKVPIPILSKENQKSIIADIQIFRVNYDKAIENENKAIELIEKEIESWQN